MGINHAGVPIKNINHGDFIDRQLQEENLLQHDDNTFSFIRNTTQLIEKKYPLTNHVLKIQSSSCRIAGHLVCDYLIKMLFAIYNVEPILPKDDMFITQSESSNIDSVLSCVCLL